MMKYYIKQSDRKNIHWLGTWGISLDDHLKIMNPIQQLITDDTIKSLIKKNKNLFANKICLFTVNIVYEINRVHFVAFYYDPSRRFLLSFDPGVQLYHHGQETIVPHVRKAFHDLGMIGSEKLKTQQNIGTCHDYSFCGKKWGVQYNGRHDQHLPADSFCQSWTIYFLIRTILDSDFAFVENWCRVSPPKREFIIISFFMLPNLLKFENLQKMFLSHLQDVSSIHKVFSILYNYLETCQFSKSEKKKRCNPSAA